MSISNKKFILVAFLFTAVASVKVDAQKMNITGDTVFVNEEPVQIKFPADIIDVKWMDQNPPYSTSIVPNTIIFEAKGANAKTARILIFEGPGPRSHSFFVAYKNSITNDTYDYSTVKKLQSRVKEIEARDAVKKAAVNEAALVAPPTPIIKAVSNASSSGTSQTLSNTSSSTSGGTSYYALLEEGDKALKSDRLDDAQSKYEEVLSTHPDNDFAKKGLANVKDKRAEKERLAKKELDDKINGMKATANKAYYAKQYDDALEGYNKVLAIQPGDLFSKSQITVIQKIKTENEAKESEEKERLAKQEQENKINTIKASATKAFNDKKYDDAIAGYTQVLDLSPNDVLAKSRLDAINKIREQDALKEKQEKENKDRDETFKTIVANADKDFDNKEYDVARAAYLAAKDLKPTDASLEKKIKLTNDKISAKENEDEYNTAIAAGDEAKKAQDYEKAKLAYTKAAKIFKDKTYPQEQINEINKAINDNTARLNSEKEKQAKDIENNNKYNLAIQKADKEFENKDFVSSKADYLAASKLKPSETYPTDKLAEIAILAENLDREKKDKAAKDAAAAELNKKYESALAKGKSAFDKKDYDVAKAAFMQAAELKPTEPEPKSKLDAVEKRLAGNGTDAKYDSAIARGNIALGEKNYPVALESYKQALRAKPLESLALNQVRAVQDMITRDSIQQAEVQRHAEIKVQEEIRKKRFDEGMTAYTNYETAAQIADYEGQLLNLKHFLNIIPDASELNTYQFNAGAKIDFAKKKILAIREYLSRTKGASYQLEAIPYLDQDLEKKYESINFTAPPEEQVYARTDSANYNENISFSKQLLTEKPRLALVDSADDIKITLQSITFKGDKVFNKFLIHNNTSAEFLTGTMQLSLSGKKDKTPTKKFASYISSFPIILPGKEFSIIYVTKDQDVKDDDTLSFDLTDRLKKKKIHISIPGTVYNQEKKLKS